MRVYKHNDHFRYLLKMPLYTSQHILNLGRGTEYEARNIKSYSSPWQKGQHAITNERKFIFFFFQDNL